VSDAILRFSTCRLAAFFGVSAITLFFFSSHKDLSCRSTRCQKEFERDSRGNSLVAKRELCCCAAFAIVLALC